MLNWLTCKAVGHQFTSWQIVDDTHKTGICSRCQQMFSFRQIPCHQCNGVGEVTVTQEKEVACGRCDNGFLPFVNTPGYCPDCNGTGIKKEKVSEIITCPVCTGLAIEWVLT